MPADNRPPAAAKPSARSAAAATNSPTSRWNGNTSTGRRARDLFRSYLKQAGSPSDPGAQAAIAALSEQVVIAEQARAMVLADGGMTMSNLALVVRCENLANRTLRRLKLDQPVSKRAGSSLDAIKAKYAQPATDEPGK
jgi:hypothetical protein